MEAAAAWLMQPACVTECRMLGLACRWTSTPASNMAATSTPAASACPCSAAQCSAVRLRESHCSTGEPRLNSLPTTRACPPADKMLAAEEQFVF